MSDDPWRRGRSDAARACVPFQKIACKLLPTCYPKVENDMLVTLGVTHDRAMISQRFIVPEILILPTGRGHHAG